MMKPSRRRGFGSVPSALNLALICGFTSALTFIMVAAAATGREPATSLAAGAGSPSSVAALKQSSGALGGPRSSFESFAEPRGLESNIAGAKVQVSPIDMAAAAGHHHGKSHGHGKYYMYTEVPKKHSYKMGFKRGNHKHTIERKESAHKSHVHSYFKWHDKKGKGSHKFEYKHEDHKKKKHHH